MKNVIICTGSPGSGIETLNSLLISSGVCEALPAAERGMTPDTWQGQVLSESGLQEIPLSAPLKPNASQKAMANDILSTNDHQALWGWASSTSTWFLDFWKERVAGAVFVLAYAEPEREYAYDLHRPQGDLPFSDDSIASWLVYNQRLLRFYNRNRERSILVNTQTALSNPARFFRFVSEKTSQQLSSSTNDLSPEAFVVNPVEAALATVSIQQHGSVRPLWLELEATATIASEKSQDVLTGAREEYLALIDSKEQLLEREKVLQHALDKAKVDSGRLDALQQKLDKAEQFNAELEQENGALQQQLSKYQQAEKDVLGKLENIESDKAELEKENELLILQLHQVQEELEHYFKLYQENESAAKENGSAALAGRYRVEMDDEFQGTNWYPCEQNQEGPFRWTGPGERATVSIPVQIIPGSMLVIEYRDTLTVEQLAGLKIEINGKNIAHQVYRDVNPGFIVVRLPGENDSTTQMLEVGIILPRTVSPTSIDTQNKDTRSLGISVKSVNVFPLQPGLCIQQSGTMWGKFRQNINRAAHKLPATGFPLSFFDGLAYLDANPDVKEDVKSQRVSSAIDHYLSEGLNQGIPLPLAVTVLPARGDILDLTRANRVDKCN